MSNPEIVFNYPKSFSETLTNSNFHLWFLQKMSKKMTLCVMTSAPLASRPQCRM